MEEWEALKSSSVMNCALEFPKNHQLILTEKTYAYPHFVMEQKDDKTVLKILNHHGKFAVVPTGSLQTITWTPVHTNGMISRPRGFKRAQTWYVVTPSTHKVLSIAYNIDGSKPMAPLKIVLELLKITRTTPTVNELSE